MKITTLIIAILLFQLELFCDDNASDLLATAVAAGNSKTAEKAFTEGADVNYIDEDWPLFITAVTSNDVKTTELFIKNSVNIEITGPDKKQLLCMLYP